jgi:hypothetical protein
MHFEQEVLAKLGLPDRDDVFLEELYAAMCNRGWTDGNGHAFHCTWRAAGGFVASYRDGDEISIKYLLGDYMDYYCAGDEGYVSDEVREAIKALGWYPCESDEAHAITYPDHAAYYLGCLQLERWLRSQGLSASKMTSNDVTQYTCQTSDDEVQVYTVDKRTGASYIGGIELLSGPVVEQCLPPAEWRPGS